MKTYDLSVIILAIALVAAGVYTVVKRARPEILDDNPVEEIIEDLIENETGADVDLTPGSSER